MDRTRTVVVTSITVLVAAIGALGWTLKQRDATVRTLQADNEKLARELDALRHPPETILDGEVFIVTKGGENVKLGLVEVGLFALGPLERNIAEKRQRASAKLEQLDPLLSKAKADRDAADAAQDRAFHAVMKAPLNSERDRAWRKSREVKW